MRTFKIDGIVANDVEIREILDSFFYCNEPDVIVDANAMRISDSAFNIMVRHHGELHLPFNED